MVRTNAGSWILDEGLRTRARRQFCAYFLGQLCLYLCELDNQSSPYLLQCDGCNLVLFCFSGICSKTRHSTERIYSGHLDHILPSLVTGQRLARNYESNLTVGTMNDAQHLFNCFQAQLLPADTSKFWRRETTEDDRVPKQLPTRHRQWRFLCTYTR